MTVLILGSGGQLATHLRQLLPDARCWGRDTLDLCQPATTVRAAIEAMKPSAIVNAAGYTSVEKAESERALAWRLNAESVAAAALAATALDVPFVHVSTDYVFDGRKTSEYVEHDAPNPLNVYGITKLAGELATRTLCERCWILRVSWVFSEHGSNFLKTMLRLAATRDELKVVADQRGRPTYAGHIAGLIVALLHRPDVLPFGTYNAVGGPAVSWHEFAETIIEEAFARGVLPRRVPVRAIATSDYSTPARRPANSVLRISDELNRVTSAIDWREGLRTAVTRLRT